MTKEYEVSMDSQDHVVGSERFKLFAKVSYQSRVLEICTSLEGVCCITMISAGEKVLASFLQSLPSSLEEAGDELSSRGRIFMELQHESVMQRVLSGDYDLTGTSDPELPALFS